MTALSEAYCFLCRDHVRYGSTTCGTLHLSFPYPASPPSIHLSGWICFACAEATRAAVMEIMGKNFVARAGDSALAPPDSTTGEGAR